jgi:phosphoglycerol transferase MdoB-like AlkP superfamily enzyme
MGDLDAVEAIILQSPKSVQIAWNNSTRIRRDSPTVAGLAQAMEYTDEQLDQIFKNAEQVQL